MEGNDGGTSAKELYPDPHTVGAYRKQFIDFREVFLIGTRS